MYDLFAAAAPSGDDAFDLSKNRKTLRPHQEKAMSMLTKSFGKGNSRPVIQAPTGGGKCLGFDTPVIMADGSVKMVQDVEVGDWLASPTGPANQVVSLGRGREKMFRVTPVKGDSWVCNASHLLSLRMTNTKCNVSFNDGQKVYGSPENTVTIEAADLYASTRTAKYATKQWRPDVVEFTGEADLSIPPYALGVWLGDGTSSRPDVTKPFSAVVDGWLEYTESVGCHERVSLGSSGCPTYHAATKRGLSNPALEALRSLGVLGNKHIPLAYKAAPVRDRLRLLAGLFDTDGYTEKSGVDFISKYEALANDVAFVCRSVGLAAYVKKCRKGIASTGFYGDYWRVSVSGDCDKIPTRRLKIAPRVQIKRHLVTGLELEPIGEGDYYGFELTGDRLFLLGDFTVTHNTLLSARIIEQELNAGGKVIFTAPAISLINQTVAAFEAEGIADIGVMQADHPRTDPRARVQVASVQTLARREVPDASLVIVDECHIRSTVIDQLISDWQGVRFIGLSATPFRKGMGLVWDDLLIPCTTAELIDGGYLSEFTAYAPDVPDMSGVKRSKGDYHEGQAADVMGDAKLMANVVQTWLERGENRPTLLFGMNCAHAQTLFRDFTAAGVAAAYVDAHTDSVERQLIERRFRAGEVKIACSVRTLTTGVDWPVSCIIDAAPTQSLALHVQKLGRGLRVNPGTEDLIILDHAGNILRHGLPSDDLPDRLDASKPGEPQEKPEPKEKLPTPCTQCATLYRGMKCPGCGHEPVPFCAPETIDQDLVEITRTKSEAEQAERRQFYGMCVWMANNRGYKPGFAGVKYKEKYGQWPPRSWPRQAVAPDRAFLNWEKSRRIAWAKAQNKRAPA